MKQKAANILEFVEAIPVSFPQKEFPFINGRISAGASQLQVALLQVV